MKKQILVNVEAGERRIAILSENRLDDYFVERLEQKTTVGNIYKGKVNSIVPGIGAAFVNYGETKNGFLYVSDAAEATPDYDEGEIIYDVENPPDDKQKRIGRNSLRIEELLKKDQEILVQVVKEELGTKGARLSTNISLPGRFLVFMPNSDKIGISRKIHDDAERKRIRDIIKAIKPSETGGVIVRTAALGCDRKDLARDIKYLARQWAHIKAASNKKRAPALLWHELDMASKVMRDMLTEEVEKIIIDEKTEYKRLNRIVANFSPDFKSNIQLYRDDEPLFERYGVEKEIDKIFNRKVFLKCGGYITIEQTEGMVAIDVNSGRFTKKKDPEETIYRVNLEAAEEAARQLRLRDVGGIIVIDFIDMAKEQHSRNIFNTLQQELKKDRAKTHIASFSELCIVEMTRQRTYKSLESFAYQSCPYCNGKGLIQSKDTVLILSIRRLKDFLKKSKARGEVEIILHPDIAEKLRKDASGYLHQLQRMFRTKIAVLENSRFHLEDIEIKRS